MTSVSRAFKVVSERNCPYYGLDDIFVLNSSSLRVPAGRPACLILVREFTSLLFSLPPGAEDPEDDRVFTCGGCTGLVKFTIDAMQEKGDTGDGAAEQDERLMVPDDAAAVRKTGGGVMLSGSLQEITPSELLQFFHMHQKTGKLVLEIPGGTARIAFREGAIIGARYGVLEGRDAIFGTLGATGGKFSFVAGIPESLQEVEDIGDFMMLLMEGLKRIDEDRAQKE